METEEKEGVSEFSEEELRAATEPLTPKEKEEAKKAFEKALREHSGLLEPDQIARLQQLKYEKKLNQGIEAVDQVLEEMGPVSSKLDERRAAAKLDRKIRKGLPLENSPEK